MPKVKARKKPKKMASIKKISKRKPIKKMKVATKKKKVLAIPKGYHTVTPYLVVDKAAKAIEFYQKAFGAKLHFKMDSPNGKITHSELKIGDAKIMLADECHEKSRSAKSFGGSPMNIHLYVKNVDKVVAKALSAGAKLIRPVENMFYGDRCGCVEDPSGYQWYIATHVENVSARELKKRVAAIFKA